METKISEKFNQLLERAKTDANVIGLFLVGSRGKGFDNEHSDYDIKIITSDEVEETYNKEFSILKSIDLDLSVMSLTNFKDYAEWNTPFAWDRYTFLHVKTLIDKTGEIQRLIDEKGVIPEKERHDFIFEAIDGYLNHVFRSVKCFRNQNIAGARLEASASIPYLLDVVFALHGRPKPFLGYLEKELDSYPLEKLPWKADEFIQKILFIISTADLATQQELLKTVEIWSRQEGFNDVFDPWGGKDKWAMTYRPQ